MKQRVLSILLVLVVVCLAGCGAKNDAETTFDTMMKALQTGDANEIRPYYDFSQESNFSNVSTANEMEDVVLATLKKMEYRVDSAERLDNNNVKMTITATTLDFTQVMNAYVEQLILMVEDDAYQSQLATMEQGDYQKLVAERMTGLLESEEIATEEKTISVTMVKQEDGTWAPGADKDEFFGALFVNLFDAVNSLI